MKKISVLAATILFSVAIVGAKELSYNDCSNEEATISVAAVGVPTSIMGTYFNGYNFIKVESSWLRVVIGGQRNTYDYHAEIDPYGNYVLTFGNSQCITIYPNGRSLNYNGTTYSKKSY